MSEYIKFWVAEMVVKATAGILCVMFVIALMLFINWLKDVNK